MQTTGVGDASGKNYKRGLVPGYRNVWLSQNITSNIISLAWIAQRFKVTFSSENWNSFSVRTTKGIMFFIQHESGLYYRNVDKKTGWSMVNAV